MNKKKTTYYVFQDNGDPQNLYISNGLFASGTILYTGTTQHCVDFIEKWHKTYDWYYERMKKNEEEANEKNLRIIKEHFEMVNDYIQEYVDQVWLKLLSIKAETLTKEGMADILLNCSTWELHVGDTYPTDKLEANNECRKSN